MSRAVFALAAEAELSLDDIQSLISAALRAQFGVDEGGCSKFYPVETFPDYVVAQGPKGTLYRIPYTLSGENVTFGDAQEVETAYVPVAEACEFIATEADATAADDSTYPIVIIKPGWAHGSLAGKSVPHYYTPEFCQMVAEAAQGIPFGRKHPDQNGPDPTGATDPMRIAGSVSDGTFDNNVAKGKVKLFAAESDLRSRLSQARKDGNLGMFGVSMLASVGGAPGKIEGKDAFVVSQLGKLYSVDLCARAGAGGQFLAAASFMGSDIAAAQRAAVKPNTAAISPGRKADDGTRRLGVSMNPRLKQLLDQLNAKNAGVAAPFWSRAVVASEAEQTALEGEVLVALAAAPAADTALAAEAAKAVKELRTLQSRQRVENKLTESKLSEPAKKLVRSHFEAVLVAESDVQDAAIDTQIASVREAFAAVETIGRPRAGLVTLDSRDKLQLAMEAMLGVPNDKGVPKFRGIKDAYIQITGDHGLDRLGSGFTGYRLASEAVTTASFPNILLDAMHKALAKDYAENDLGGLQNTFYATSLDDYRTRNIVRDGYFGELPIVSEGGAYTEIGYPSDEKAYYTPQKRGNVLTITEETIRNDDLGAIARWPGKLGRAARNGLRSFIVNFFANNPTYLPDGLTIFHANHNNLGSSALSTAALDAAQLALRLQQEPGSDEPLGLTLSWVAVPPQLESLAKQINQTNTAGSNAWFQRFGANNERIFVVEKFTDDNDWYYGAPVADTPFMEIGFLDGKQEPEIFLANLPTQGTMFTTDEIQYKVKFVYGGTVIDYRGVGKNVVAG